MRPKARYSILVVNVLIAVLGISLFALGVIWIDLEIKYEAATQKPYIYVGAILISIGLVLSFTTAFACYAVITKNQRILNIVAFLSVLLFILYADYGTVAFQLKSSSTDYMEDFREELEDVFTQPKANWDTFYDYLHHKLHCCGYYGPEDFQKIHNRTHPTSCCAGNSSCGKPTYTTGCVTLFEDYVKQNFIASGSVAFVISVLNLLSFSINYVAKINKNALSE